MDHLDNDKSYLRVGTERSSHYEEWGLVVVNSPQSPVITSSIQVPDTETLGKGQPAGEVLGVAHRDEQDVTGTLLRHQRPELFIARRSLRVHENIGFAQRVAQ